MSEELQIRVRTFPLVETDYTTKEEKSFYKSALKAYLKGRPKFKHGFTTVAGQRVPAWFSTPIQYK